MRGEAARQLMLAAAQLAKEDQQNEEDACGLLPPCRLLPSMSHYTRQEYEMMERDRGKYLLYMAAIEAAIEDLVAQESTLGDLVVLVLGGGYGRLAEFCRASLLKRRCHCRLILLEANPEACQVLESRFRSSTESGSSVKISILDPTTLLPSNSHAVATKNGIYKACDLVVSELLGSFADNELLPEITTPLVRDFLKQGSGVCIPASYETFVGPLEWPGLQQTVVDCSGNPAHGRGRLHSAHTATAAPQSEWLFRWSSLPSLYSWSAAVATEQTRTPMGGWTQFEMPRDGCIHAIGGWFTAHLYGDLHIDSRLTEHRNAFHWETFVLPLESPVEVRARDAVGITVERHTRVSEQPYIWYEWGCTLCRHQHQQETRHNKAGWAQQLAMHTINRDSQSTAQ